MEILFAVISISLNLFSVNPNLKADLGNFHSHWQKPNGAPDIYIKAHHQGHDYDQGQHQGQSNPWIG